MIEKKAKVGTGIVGRVVKEGLGESRVGVGSVQLQSRCSPPSFPPQCSAIQ